MPPSSSTHFFSTAPAAARDAAAGGDAAGQRDRGDARVRDQRRRPRRSAPAACGTGPSRKAGVAEHRLDRERAARDVAGVLQHGAVAGHQRRRGEAEHLPERKVPRHHREHDAERVEGHEGLRAVDVDRLAREVRRGVVGEVVAGARALVDLGAAVGRRSCPSRRSSARRTRRGAAAATAAALRIALGARGEVDAAPLAVRRVAAHRRSRPLRRPSGRRTTAALERRRVGGGEAGSGRIRAHRDSSVAGRVAAGGSSSSARRARHARACAAVSAARRGFRPRSCSGRQHVAYLHAERGVVDLAGGGEREGEFGLGLARRLVEPAAADQPVAVRRELAQAARVGQCQQPAASVRAAAQSPSRKRVLPPAPAGSAHGRSPRRARARVGAPAAARRGRPWRRGGSGSARDRRRSGRARKRPVRCAERARAPEAVLGVGIALLLEQQRPSRSRAMMPKRVWPKRFGAIDLGLAAAPSPPAPGRCQRQARPAGCAAASGATPARPLRRPRDLRCGVLRAARAIVGRAHARRVQQ